MWLHHKDSPKREIMTYALLDEASDTTFIKSEVLKNLGPKGPEVKLNLSTMLGRQEIPVEKISGLVVETIDERVKIELPKTYDQIYLSEETINFAIFQFCSQLELAGSTCRAKNRIRLFTYKCLHL